MNFKLKRTTRTPNSEEIAIYDPETLDEHDQPVNIGKMDVHYVDDQIVGTLLIWQEFAQGYNATHGPGSDETMDDLIDAILSELAEPLGVPAEYGIEVYYPSVTNQTFISNYSDDQEEGEGGGEADQEAENEPDNNDQSRSTQDDDYYRKLTRRPGEDQNS